MTSAYPLRRVFYCLIIWCGKWQELADSGGLSFHRKCPLRRNLSELGFFLFLSALDSRQFKWKNILGGLRHVAGATVLPWFLVLSLWPPHPLFGYRALEDWAEGCRPWTACIN